MDREIIEQSPDELVIEGTLISTARNFDVLARSQLDAAAKLRRQRNIGNGTVWQTAYGELVDLTVIARAVIVTPVRDAPLGGVGQYQVKVRYERRTGADREPVPDGGPVYRLGGSLGSSPVDLDAAAVPITNAADEPMDPPLTVMTPNEVVRGEWYVRSINPIGLQASLRPLRGAVNAVAWQEAMPGSVLCGGAEIVEELDDGWYRLGADFMYRDPIDPASFPDTKLLMRKSDGKLEVMEKPVGGWHGIYANRGRREKREIDGETRYVRIRMPVLGDDGEPKLEDGQPVLEPVDEPVDLDVDGKRLEKDQKRSAIVVPLYRKMAHFQAFGI